MSRRRRHWRRYGRPNGVIINADRVIITREDENDPPPPAFAVLEFILGGMGGMLLARLIDIGKVIVLQ